MVGHVCFHGTSHQQKPGDHGERAEQANKSFIAFRDEHSSIATELLDACTVATPVLASADPDPTEEAHEQNQNSERGSARVLREIRIHAHTGESCEGDIVT